MTIAELRALLARATPGPWTPSDDDPGDVVLYGPDEEWLANVGNWARQHEEIDAKVAARQACEFRDAADAQLVAAMRAALPALLDVAAAAAQFIENDGFEEHTRYDASASYDARVKLGAALDALRLTQPKR